MLYTNLYSNKKIVFTSKSFFSTIAQAPVKTASNRLNYFFRRGKKGATETKMRSRFLDRAKKNPMINTDNTSQRSSRFKSFFIYATPFIGLKTRRMRRGKRVLNKVITLTRMRSQRKSFLEFASTVCVSGRSTKPFRVRLENELEMLYSSSRKRNIISQSNGTSLQDKRALLYATAYTAMGSARTIKSKGKVNNLFTLKKHNQKL